MSELKHFHFTSAGLFYGVGSLSEAIAASQEGGFIWMNYYKPEKADLMKLVEVLGIHPLSVEDCLDNRQVPKIEHFPNNTFIIFNSFRYAGKELHIDEINLFIGNNFLISVSGHNSDSRRPLSEIESIVSNDIGSVKSSPARLMHIILDYLVDQKFEAFEALEDELGDSEESVVENPSSFDPADLMRVRKCLLSLRKSLFHEREILVKICRLDCPFITEKDIFHFRDIYDHLAKFFELTETYREIVISQMELFTSLLNNLMTKMSNETNSSVRRLTLIATVFMPLTLLASIGGMSEWSMITGPSNWKISYPLFILAMVIIAVINYVVIRRIERRGRVIK